MYSRIRSAVCAGIEGKEVFVETDITRGLPSISVVGLASATVMESKERIKSAILNSGFEYPRVRVTINLMPADLKKNSSCLDLPIAMGILISEMPECPEELNEFAVIGELALDGRINDVRGALPMLMKMKRAGIEKVIVPEANAREALMAGITAVYAASGLTDAMEILINPMERELFRRTESDIGVVMYAEPDESDFRDVSGQENAKRAVLIAAAGRHGLLMVGSPGCGKTMLAGRIPGIMPAMSEREMTETAVIRSLAGPAADLISPRRPFRHPHHTIGREGLLGGGSNIALPGEITLAHNGSLITADHAARQGRTVYAVPGPINSQFSIGCNLLIRDGAPPLVLIDDLIRDLNLGESIGKNPNTKVNLAADELEIYEALSRMGGATVDEIVRETGKSASMINAVATILEIKGITETYAGRIYISS